MTLEILEPGLATMVQGLPFRGMRHLGLPLAGAADPVALALANWLVGNEAEAAALETAYAPLTMRALNDCTVAIQGAAMAVELDGITTATDSAIAMGPGQILKIPAPSGGCRSYLAIAGGISVEPVLGATSTYTPARLGGIDGRSAGRAQIMTVHPSAGIEPRTIPEAYRLPLGLDFLLRIIVGPESDWIEPNILCSQNWTISRRADRVGLELKGIPLKPLRTDPMDSCAVFPGTVQCPPSGSPFMLGPDAQTTGGYPRIAQVIRADRHLIGQLRPGARLRFQRIEPAEARRLYRSKIALIRQLQPDFRLE